jgi:hypothetical protein
MIAGLGGMANLNNMANMANMANMNNLNTMGNLSTMVSWMQQFDPQNLFVNLGPELDPSVAMGNTGTMAVPGVNFDELRQTMMTLQETTALFEERDRLFAERGEKDLEEEKADYFRRMHYEWPDGPEGEPVAVSGPETPEQAVLRQKYERRKLEAFQDAQVSASKTPPSGSARAQLSELTGDYTKMQELLSQPDGQQRFQELAEQARVEEENASIQARAQELKQTMPSALHGRVDEVRDNVLARRASTRAQLAATPEALAVKNYQESLQEWAAAQKRSIAEFSDNWKPYNPQIFQP